MDFRRAAIVAVPVAFSFLLVLVNLPPSAVASAPLDHPHSASGEKTGGFSTPTPAAPKPKKGAPASPYVALGGPLPDGSGFGLYLAVELTPAELVEHVEHDGATDVEIFDANGRRLEAGDDGVLRLTDYSITASEAAERMAGTFKAARTAIDRGVADQPATCALAKQQVLDELAFSPSNRSATTGTMTAAPTWPTIAADAYDRVAWMHDPQNDVPLECQPDPAHKAGYLHNLWHRIMGT